MSANILIIEDDPLYARLLSRIATDEGLSVTIAMSGEDALQSFEETQPAVVLCDIGLPGMDGVAVLEELARRSPAVVSIVVTGLATVENAVAAMRAGAFDVIQKSGEVDEIRLRLKRAFETASLKRQVEYFAERQRNFGEIVGESAPMREVRRRIEEVAHSPSSTVLIVGETGTGKELVARAVHACSARSANPLISVNCAAVPDSLIESEFFGHERGAFTGADRTRAGLFETANGSSLFLDEIGELDLKIQVKLLRVLEERIVKRVGGTRELRVDVRLIAATNRDLEAEVAAGRFRQDLLYRVNVFRIDVPPLRDRGDDVLLLARHFMLDFARQLGKKVNVLDPEAERILLGYDYPGNVRQLRNIVEQAMILARGDRLTPDLLRGARLRGQDETTTISLRREMTAGSGSPAERMAIIEKRRDELEECERSIVTEALVAANGNKTKAAEALGISRFALGRRLKGLRL